MTFLSPITLDISKIVNLLDKYEEECELVDQYFDLSSAPLIKISQQLPKKVAQFKKYDSELKGMIELVELRRSEYEGQKWKALLEHNNRHLSSKDLQQYINGDKEYVCFSEIIVQVNYVRNKVLSVLEALTTLNWQIGHQTKLAISSLEDYVI